MSIIQHKRVSTGCKALLCLSLVGCAATVRAETRPPADAMDHWAFHPPREVAPPKVKNTDWPKTGIDRFILAKLEAAEMDPAPATDPRTLLRRMSFDLTGLPPSYEETVAFKDAVTRDGEQAIVNAINRLLASPRYGERWGRHWLDVARYSDTKGYVYAREERRFPHAPTYRDWVIRAFNEDLPYDRFLLLQMAADQLVAPNSPDLAAMGFITGGRRFIGVTHDIIDDRIDVVTRGTMALTVQCARCHDHKYDPIPTADYYSLYGVFHGANDQLVPLGNLEDEELNKRRDKLAGEMEKQRGEAGKRFSERVGEYLAAQLELEKYPAEGFDQILVAGDIFPAAVRRWRDFLHTNVDARHPIFGVWSALSELDVDEFEATAPATLARTLDNDGINPLIAAAFQTVPIAVRDVARRYGEAFANARNNPELAGAAELLAFLKDPNSPTTVPDTGIVNNELFFPTAIVDQLWKLQGEVDRRLIELGAPAARVLVDRNPEPNPRIFKRGSASLLGDEVPRQFLGLISREDRQPFRHGNGRLEMAEAIATADNPLTARVMVNRIWQHHFGIGLVRTSSDFGLRAEAPSHPGLLDWLALQFVESGWSVKAMHRLILSSAVYQQSSAVSKTVIRRSANSEPVAQVSAGTTSLITDSLTTDYSQSKDPDNRLLSHFPIRRLEFEQLRDSMLAVSGDLDFATSGKSLDLLDDQNNRRTVYAYVDRQFLPGTFRTFDFANPDIHVAVRHETTVPQQALFFLNGDFAASRARSLNQRYAELPPEERVQQFHQTVYQRVATTNEVRDALNFVTSAEADQPPPPPEVPETSWQYGTGEYDVSAGQLKSFTPLPHFTGSAWQGAAAWPGGETGWAQLTANGGHPGNTLAHACVRRWVAPTNGIVNISGTLKHEPEAGDGIRGFIVSSRHGRLKAVTVHHSEEEMSAEQITVEPGDTIEFIVDIADNLNSDQFLWEPVIEAGKSKWVAKTEFVGPSPEPDYLTPWEQYAQVLLLANEFAFVD